MDAAGQHLGRATSGRLPHLFIRCRWQRRGREQEEIERDDGEQGPGRLAKMRDQGHGHHGEIDPSRPALAAPRRGPNQQRHDRI